MSKDKLLSFKEYKEKALIELLSFKKHQGGTMVSVNVVLDVEEALKLEEVWFHKVKGCQAPLIGTYKNGFSVFIPWILKEGDSL